MRKAMIISGLGLVLLGATPEAADAFGPTGSARGNLRTEATIAPPANTDAATPGQTVPLYLAVTLNGRDTGIVAQFDLDPATNRLSSPRSELEEVGLKPSFGLSRRIWLDQVPGLGYRYDANSQSVAITARNDLLRPEVISAVARDIPERPQKSWGAVLNYDMQSQATWASGSQPAGLGALNIDLDGWIFSPLGTLRSTGYFAGQGNAVGQGRMVRLDTAWRIDNLHRALTATLGDFASSSLPWGRSIRMGGVQIRRNFSLRDDLVPQQMFSYSGAAAVPSTVDVFIQNSRTYTTGVQAGPFRLEDLPTGGGAGDATIVLRDKNGQETTRKVSFFAAENLIKKGMADFSLEAGKPREGYGTQSDAYGAATAWSGSLRYGLSRRLTLQAHAEGTRDLTMWGLGFTTTPFNVAETTLAAGRSRYKGTDGGFLYATLRTEVRGTRIKASVLRSDKGFADLAYVTGLDYLGSAAVSGSSSLLEFPRAQEVVSVTLPIGTSDHSVGLSLVHSQRASSHDLIVAATYNRPVAGRRRGSFAFDASHNFFSGDTRVGLSLALTFGGSRYAQLRTAQGPNGETSRSVYISRAISDRVGDYGYSAQITKQAGGAYASLRGDYRTRIAKIGADLITGGGSTTLRPRIEGAIVMAGGQVALGNRINDSFAIIDAGAPGVPIELQNRVVARTGRGGRALVPGLTSFRTNRLSVPVDKLAPDVTLGVTAADVVPALRSGVLVDFKGQETGNSALLVLRDAKGRPLPIGAAGALNGGKAEIDVGYDGQTWAEGLRATNVLKIDLPDGRHCTARFAFAPDPSAVQQTIDPVRCK